MNPRSTPMAQSARQLVLDLAHRPAQGAEDFLVSPANGAAVALVDRWPDWPAPSALVIGPPQSGKSHLAQVWSLRSGAGVVAANAASEATVEQLVARGALVIEDIDRGPLDERVLFHLLNAAREHTSALLITSARAAEDLDIGLPDLRSRLRALPLARIDPPDEALIGAVLVKLFADRQLAVEPPVIAHVARHAERSMATLVGLVAAIDREALASKRRVTRALAAEVMARLGQGDGRDADDERA